ncbi:MAG: hypothetical protein AB7L09_01385 [Nitrospira sp.]
MSNSRSTWKSLLSALLDAGVEEFDVWMAENARGEWDYAFWQNDADGVMVAYRCPQTKNIWTPVETPAFTGQVRRYERPEEQYPSGGSGSQ